MPSSWGSSRHGDGTQVCCTGRQVLYHQFYLGSLMYQTPKAPALTSWGVREHFPSLPTRRGSPADAGGRADRAIGGGGRGATGAGQKLLSDSTKPGEAAVLGKDTAAMLAR